MATVAQKSRGGSRPGERRGGRKKGTPNKVTSSMREAIVSVYGLLQEESGDDHAHFLGWARDNATEFYKIASKLLPLQVTGENGAPLQVVMQNLDDRI